MMNRPHFDEIIKTIPDKEYALACTQTFDSLYIVTCALNTLFGESKGAFSASDVIAVSAMIEQRHRQGS